MLQLRNIRRYLYETFVDKLNYNQMVLKYTSCKIKKPICFEQTGFTGIVGMAGFEPAASTSQMWRDTGLRYIPKWTAKVSFKNTAANIFSNFHYKVKNEVLSDRFFYFWQLF